MGFFNKEDASLQEKKAELERLIDYALKDNKITDTERELLLKKADDLGIDLDVFELELNNRLAEKQKAELYELVDQYLQDGVLDEKERDFLLDKALSIGLDSRDFEAYLNRKIKVAARDVVPNSTIPANEKEKRKNQEVNGKKGFRWGLAALIAVILVSIGLAAAAIYANNHENKPIDLSVYVKENPQLIFQTISFSKYVILHTPEGINDHLRRETAYHVRATGKYYFDLNNLVVDKKRTNSHKRILYLNCISPTDFPICVDIDIKQSDITKIESFDPTPVSESEAENIAKPVSYIAGGIGAFVGGKIGGSAGSKFGKIGTLVGASVGAVSLGAAAGQMTYVKTRDYFAELKLTSGYSVEMEESMLFGVKQLMAAEMLNIDFGDKNWENDRKTYYQNAMEQSLSKVMGKLGWSEVHIQFDYINNKQSVESK